MKVTRTITPELPLARPMTWGEMKKTPGVYKLANNDSDARFISLSDGVFYSSSGLPLTVANAGAWRNDLFLPTNETLTLSFRSEP